RHPDVMAAQAKDWLRSGDFEVPKMALLLNEENVAKVAAFARRRFAKKAMSVQVMKMFLGALSAVRCEDAYKELLAAFVSKHAPYGLRQQALVSLLHARDEAAPPEYVISMVADVAHSKTDPMAWEATMLLGSLLQKHQNTMSDAHVTAFVDELDHI